MRKFVVAALMIVYGSLCIGGVQSAYAQETKMGEGAVVGGLLGAVAGGVIGKQSHKTTQGALIGGAVGALGGAAVGSQLPNTPAGSTSSSTPSRPVSTSSSSSKVTIKQIVYWTDQGLPTDEIIARIRKSGTIFSLTQDDVDYLQKQGVSQRVIEEMQR